MITLWRWLVQWLRLMLQWVPWRNTNQPQNGSRENGCRKQSDIKCPKCPKSIGHPTAYTFFPDIKIEDLLKKKSTDEKIAFKKLFCALLNGQEANLVVFHVTDCRIVDEYDKKVNDILESLVPDGCDYQQKFERRDYDTEHFGVRVKPSKDNESCILSTMNFHTCFSHDKGLNKQPTHFVMQTFLKRPNHDSDLEQSLPKKNDFIVNQEVLIDGKIAFTENLYRQAKGSEHEANGNKPNEGKGKLGKQKEKGSKHRVNENEPSEGKEKLGEHQEKGSKHTVNGNEPSEGKEKLGEHQEKGSEHETNGNEPSEGKAKLGEHQEKGSEHETNGNEPSEGKEKLGEHQEKGSKLETNGNEPSEGKAKLGEHQEKGSKLETNGNEPSEGKAKLGEHQEKGSKLETNGNEPSEGKEKLGQHQEKGFEHETNGNEPSEGKEKLGQQQDTGSEHEANSKVPRKWKDTLVEYISAFSKVPGGGTIYFGVDEQKEKKQGCELTRFICKGVHLNEEKKKAWTKFCHEERKKMLWVAHNHTESSPGIEVDFIRPKNAPEECCVIIVTVKQFKGVGFLRKGGPESYLLGKNDKPTEVKSWAEWARLSHCKDLVVVSTD